MSYGHQPQTGQYGGGYYPNYNQQQGMYPTPPGAFAHHPHAPYPFPQGGYHPGVSQQQGAGQPSYVPPPQFTGFFLDDYHGGDEAMDDDDDEQDEEEVVQVSEEVADMVVKRVAVQSLSSQGFKSAPEDTLNILVHETISYMENLYESARQYADLAGNSKPSTFDVLAALEDQGVTARDLSPRYPPGHETLTLANGGRRRAKKRKRKVPGEPVIFDTGDISDPEPVFEADEVPYIPQTFRGPPFPHYLPHLPAKHTYLCSPPSPPQRSTLSLSVEKKLQNTAQVRNALKSLMDATDEPTEPIKVSPAAAAAPLPLAASASNEESEPQELEGEASTTTAAAANAPVIPPRSYKLKQANIVNWQESFAMTRKRWKVTAH